MAFILNAFARQIVSWWVANILRKELVLDTMWQAIWTRGQRMGETPHSNRGSQYLSIRYSVRLAEAGY